MFVRWHGNVQLLKTHHRMEEDASVHFMTTTLRKVSLEVEVGGTTTFLCVEGEDYYQYRALASFHILLAYKAGNLAM